jgi:hypothetical protein
MVRSLLAARSLRRQRLNLLRCTTTVRSVNSGSYRIAIVESGSPQIVLQNTVRGDLRATLESEWAGV